MQEISKYLNLHEVVPKLPAVLLHSIQDDCLEIREVNTEAEKFQSILERFSVLKDAKYVIFSKFIKKCEHQHEMFIFLNHEGVAVKHISGRELALYGIIKPCSEIKISEEFAYHEAS